jgi:hypothetical protein
MCYLQWFSTIVSILCNLKSWDKGFRKHLIISSKSQDTLSQAAQETGAASNLPSFDLVLCTKNRQKGKLSPQVKQEAAKPCTGQVSGLFSLHTLLPSFREVPPRPTKQPQNLNGALKDLGNKYSSWKRETTKWKRLFSLISNGISQGDRCIRI